MIPNRKGLVEQLREASNNVLGPPKFSEEMIESIFKDVANSPKDRKFKMRGLFQ